MNTEPSEREEAPPERIYVHPTSSEYHLNKWPLEESEYVEYVRADLASRASVAAPEGDAAIERKNVLGLIERFQREPKRSQGTKNAFEWLRRQIEEGNHAPHKFEPPPENTGRYAPDECYRCGLHRAAIMHFLHVVAASSSAPAEPPPDDDATLIRLDREFIAGARLGYSLGVEGNRTQLYVMISARLEDIRAAKSPSAAEPLQQESEQGKCPACGDVNCFDHALRAAPPITPSDAAMRAAEEISSTFGLKFQRDSLHRVAAIIARHLGAPEGDVESILQRLVETPAGERIRMKCGAADLRSVITDVLASKLIK